MEECLGSFKPIAGRIKMESREWKKKLKFGGRSGYQLLPLTVSPCTILDQEVEVSELITSGEWNELLIKSIFCKEEAK